mgnify:CR=1 FL=1
MIEFKKGDVLEVTQFNKGWDADKMAYCDEVQIVDVKSIMRRGGKTRVKVSSRRGYGFTIVVEEFLNGKIVKVGA